MPADKIAPACVNEECAEFGKPVALGPSTAGVDRVRAKRCPACGGPLFIKVVSAGGPTKADRGR